MKKLLQEALVVLVIFLAMYFLADSENLQKRENLDLSFQQSGVEAEKQAAPSEQKDAAKKSRFLMLKNAREELKLYRICKKQKLVREVIVRAEAGDIDLNSCRASELTALKGIGKALSKRIVEYRTEHGPFADVKELTKVKGIGEKKLKKILGS